MSPRLSDSNAGSLEGERGQDLFLNRELSWLEFNRRVLSESLDPAVPLAERLKFTSIVGSNLDEFFMVRVAGIKQLISSDVTEPSEDGLTPQEQLAIISKEVHGLVGDLSRNWAQDLAPALATRAGVHILRTEQLTQEQQSGLREHFARDVWPVLTPLAVDQGHPFPMLRNRSLNLAIVLHKDRQRMARRHTTFAVVQVPAVLPRLVEVPAVAPQRAAFVLLEDVIAMHIGDLFPGFRVLSCSPFRVTRNFDLSIDEDEADDLLKTIQRELRRRERGQAVRLEIAANVPAEAQAFLRQSLRLEKQDVYEISGPLHLSDLAPLCGRDELRELRDEAFTPQRVPPLSSASDVFDCIAQQDILLHHPYETFDHVVEFISSAADDSNVLAIKQTLYRTSPDSPIIRALVRAAENGKQVTAVVELKARFDEGSNIAWARLLEDAGVHVVYGLVGLKTHCKMCLVVRREATAIRRYVHLATGNYNASTARTYGDVSYFTAREAFADDAGALFNLLTGYSSPPSWKRFSVAPLGLGQRIAELIEREIASGDKGRIVAKMNALVDPEVIRHLYRASRAGVQIDLLVRGICCLRPGVPGLSDNIRVTSVVDRFLEHARIFCFEAGGRREVYLSSADWMPRNLTRRIEIMFPIEDPALRDRVGNAILSPALADRTKASRLLPDGTYERLTGPIDPVHGARSQQRFMALARERARSGETADRPRRPRPVTATTSPAPVFLSVVPRPDDERDAAAS